jgi:hypothetical protein
VTRVRYRDGKVSAVERNDGTTLKVHRDGLGRLAAVTVGSEAAAFTRAEDGGGDYVLANKVQLLFEGGAYAGFSHTTRTEYLHDINPDDVLTTIVRNFIAEGDQP